MTFSSLGLIDPLLRALDTRVYQMLTPAQVQPIQAVLAARGRNIDDLPHVVKLELPVVAGDYIHRTGHTTCAGAIGETISLTGADEVQLVSANELLLRQTLPRSEEPGFEAGHQVPMTDVSGQVLKKPKKPPTAESRPADGTCLKS